MTNHLNVPLSARTLAIIMLVIWLAEPVAAQWYNDEFTIGVWGPPIIQGDGQDASRFAPISALGANLIVYTNQCDRNNSSDGSLWDPSYTACYPYTPDNISGHEEYIGYFSEAADTNNLRFFASDYTMFTVQGVCPVPFEPTEALNRINFYQNLNTQYQNTFSGFMVADEPRHQEAYPENDPNAPLWDEPFARCRQSGPRYDPAYNWHTSVTTWTEYFRNYFPDKLSYVDLLTGAFGAYTGWNDVAGEVQFDKYVNGSSSYTGYYNNDCIECLDAMDHQNYLYLWLNLTRQSNPPHSMPLDKRYYNAMRLHREKANERPAWGVVDVTQFRRYDVDNISYNFGIEKVRNEINSYMAHGYRGFTLWEYANPTRTALASKTTGAPTVNYPLAQETIQFAKNFVGPMIINSEHVGTFHSGDFKDFASRTIEVIPPEHLIGAQPSISGSSSLDNINEPNILVGVFQQHDSFISNGTIQNEETYYYIVNRGFDNADPSRSINISIPGDHQGSISIADQASGTYQNASTFSGFGLTTIPVNNLLPGEGRLLRVINGPLTILKDTIFGPEYDNYVWGCTR